MPSEIRATLALLKRAMKIEEEGRRFYLKAAQSVENGTARETYAALAEDEQIHFDLLKEQHDSLTIEGRWVRSPQVKPATTDLNKPLFPKGREALEAVLSSRSDGGDVLLFGLGIETKSYDLYRQGAGETADPLGRHTFEFLADQERSHFNVLMMRYESLYGPTTWHS
jgi:rubrerythrin